MRRWGWRWLAFFAAQAPLLLLESALRRWARPGGGRQGGSSTAALPLSPAPARLCVLVALGMLAEPLFFPVLTQPVVAARAAASVRRLAADAGAVLRAAAAAAAAAGGCAR